MNQAPVPWCTFCDVECTKEHVKLVHTPIVMEVSTVEHQTENGMRYWQSDRAKFEAAKRHG